MATHDASNTVQDLADQSDLPEDLDQKGVEENILERTETDKSNETINEEVEINSDYSNISNPDNEDDSECTEQQRDLKEGTSLDESEKEIPKDQMRQSVDKSKRTNMNKSDKELQLLCDNMFSKLEDYLKGEVASSVEDYDLLERMNKTTSYKYQNMLQVATTVSQSMRDINQKFSNLRPYLEQIEKIEENVLALEQAAYKLDGYAKRLEERFRKLEKR